jgi:AcrR family transcriptional regulator
MRGEILAASQRIVLEEGFRALSMRRVAKAIGYSATAIYLYFENRDAIVAELGRRALVQLVQDLEKVDGALAPRQRLRSNGAAYLRFSENHPDAYRLIFMQDSELAMTIFRDHDEATATGAGARAFALLAQPFFELQNLDTRWKGRDPVTCAEVFWTALHGIAALKLTCAKFLRTPAEDLLSLAISALFAGLPEAAVPPPVA